ncbi:MAG: protein translocase subunit SecD [Nitrospirae bacterium]|nr:protein translocase subunit SecD [Nitrospirota bacterium]
MSRAKQSLTWRFGLIGGLTLLALVLFLPSTPLSDHLPGVWRETFPKIALGLDLQGGIYLLLQVQGDKAVENAAGRVAEGIRDALKGKGIAVEEARQSGPTEVTVTLATPEAKAQAAKRILEQYPVLDSKGEGDRQLTYLYGKSEVARIKEWAAAQALETIRNRIDKFGVREPLIQRQGTNEIVVQLPGMKEPERAVALLGKTAQLEFKLVDDEIDWTKALQGEAPEGREILYQKVADRETGTTRQAPILLWKKALLAGDAIADARVSIDQRANEPYVSLTFDAAGAQRFEKITAEHVKKRLAIILDGTVYSAPVIQERIAGGQAQITGRFTPDEAKDLAIVLRAGALPAPVKILQNVTVGPSLGQDSIDMGIRATILGVILVVAFMLFYYRLSGLIADFALLLNFIMLLGALAWFNATLTLPGIAGIILMMGMGVDSNVLILERIKEELRLGKSVRAAIEGGYDKAFWTIVDSHVTTLIAAAVLFQFGSGPIKGFAVTLSVGILINLFTAIVGTRVVYDWMISRRQLQRLSI